MCLYNTKQQLSFFQNNFYNERILARCLLLYQPSGVYSACALDLFYVLFFIFLEIHTLHNIHLRASLPHKVKSFFCFVQLRYMTTYITYFSLNSFPIVDVSKTSFFFSRVKMKGEKLILKKRGCYTGRKIVIKKSK